MLQYGVAVGLSTTVISLLPIIAYRSRISISEIFPFGKKPAVVSPSVNELVSTIISSIDSSFCIKIVSMVSLDMRFSSITLIICKSSQPRVKLH